MAVETFEERTCPSACSLQHTSHDGNPIILLHLALYPIPQDQYHCTVYVYLCMYIRQVMNKWLNNFFQYLDRYYVKYHSLPTLEAAGVRFLQRA